MQRIAAVAAAFRCPGLAVAFEVRRQRRAHASCTVACGKMRRCTRVVGIFPNAESCLRWERGLPGRIQKSRQGCRRSWKRRAGTDASAGRVA